MQAATRQPSRHATRPQAGNTWAVQHVPTACACKQRPRAAAIQRATRSVNLATLASAEPFAAADPFLPLSSIADMRRQTQADLDDFFSASPFSTMRRFDEMMDQQFQQMDSFGGPSFSSMRGLEGRMQQQMQEMDRQFDKAFADMDRVQQQLDAELQRSLRQLQEQQPGVRIERREEKAPGSYRYYESIQISSSSTSWTTLTPPHSTPFFDVLTFAALVLAGAYAAITAAFARNFDLTTYGERSKWRLLLLWPVLALFSRPFWRQFSSALRGEKVRVQDSVDGSSDTNSSSSS